VTGAPAPKETIVKVADWAAGRADAVLVTLGLGSCVAIMLHDPHACAGAMAHILLPSKSLARDSTNPAKFPETAVPLLVHRLATLGADPRHLVAKLAGGASMFAQFADALTPGGLLLLGKVETLEGPARERLTLEDPRERIYRRPEA